ncbi:MAG: hypothetical protein A2049_02000 [Elusimicrobia bacterium GWA2_62_23]|nr:MAG: hypothetical protein A2049_02000 [Elusimicrobia bacterium GWA2_62_23]OGR72109.1 MAG: hypothetical protein A2179_02025 [Elusimicrobia bacterium GWC2_63_65]
MREVAADVLAADYEVLQAMDGQDGWEKAQAFKPDLVVSDLMMPRMHGYELCAKLKGDPAFKGVKVIITSTKSFSTDKEQAANAGADSYVVKPFEPDTLLSKAAELLSGKAAPFPAPPAPPKPAAAAAPVPVPAAAPVPDYAQFWGTRGSCPTPGQSTVRYGGNTACVELRVGGEVLIFDCGTGIRGLGFSLAREFKGRPLSGHIFVGHTHWDHIQGFPFFVPLFNPANNFSIYNVHGAHGSLEGIFKGSMAADYFPIPLTSLGAELKFIEMSGAVQIGKVTVSFTHLNHPGVAIGFRADCDGRSVAYISDHETFARLNGATDVARRQDSELTRFYGGCDLLIREAQYTEEEYASRKGWGHSTFSDVVDSAVTAGVKRLAFIHHDPDHNDETMDKLVEYCRARAAGRLDCFAAMEGRRVDF